MLRTSIALAFVIALAGAAAAAENSMHAPRPAAPPPVVVPFTLDGIAYRFQIPTGFCVPTFDYALRASRTAAGDASNLTNVSFNDCASMTRGGDLLRWGMVKTPRNLATQDMGTRDQLIALLKAQFASGEFVRSINQGISNAARGGETARVRPLGTDPYGAYVGGTLTLNGRTFAAAWSMTAVKRRMLAIYMYGPHSGPADVQDIIDRVRTATRQLVVANGG